MAHVLIDNYAFDSDANFQSNDPILGAGVIAIAFMPGGDYRAKKGDGSSVYTALGYKLFPFPIPPVVFKTAYDAIVAQGAKITALEAKVPVPITPIVGGSQATTSTSLADVTGSTMNLAAATSYEVEWLATHSAAATTTGAFFSINGTAGNSYFAALVIGDTLAADGNARAFNALNGGTAFASSRAATLNKVLIRASIRTTTAGTIVLRFATEVNASAITITALQGYSKVVS